MPIDDEWKKIYDRRATQDIPEHLKGYWTKPGYEQLLRVTLSMVKELEDKNMLDVGCGVGRYCAEISKLGLDTTGVDYSEKLIEQARKNYPDLKFEVTSGYSLPFESKSFDLVISIGVLQCVENYKGFLEELARVANKHIIISTLLNEEKKDLELDLINKLKSDSSPTREYHPDQICEILKGFECKFFTHEKDKKILDGFFIVATRI